LGKNNKKCKNNVKNPILCKNSKIPKIAEIKKHQKLKKILRKLQEIGKNIDAVCRRVQTSVANFTPK